MDFLRGEYGVIFSEFENIDRGDSRGQYFQIQKISHHIHRVKSPQLFYYIVDIISIYKGTFSKMACIDFSLKNISRLNISINSVAELF